MTVRRSVLQVIVVRVVVEVVMHPGVLAMGHRIAVRFAMFQFPVVRPVVQVVMVPRVIRVGTRVAIVVLGLGRGGKKCRSEQRGTANEQGFHLSPLNEMV